VIRYCGKQGKTIFESLIAGSLSQEVVISNYYEEYSALQACLCFQVFSTAFNITLLWSIQKCLKWTRANAKGTVSTESLMKYVGSVRTHGRTEAQLCFNWKQFTLSARGYRGQFEGWSVCQSAFRRDLEEILINN